MRIVRLQAEGFKRLVAVDITPEGDLVEVRGENGNGKSSVLDAIYSVLAGAGALPEEPVRQGEEDAIIRLDLGELVATRYFTAEGTTKLKVTSPDGATFTSGQTMLDKLVGHISFDPLKFRDLKPEEQAEELRQLVDINAPETGEVLDLEAMAAANKADYDARRDINREATALRAKVESRGLYEVPEDAPDPAAIMDKIANAAETNNSIAEQSRDRAAKSAWLKAEEEELRAIVQRVVRMRADADELEAEGREREAVMKARADELVALPPLPEEVDVSVLRQEHADAMRIAENARLNSERRGWIASYREMKAKSDALTEAMRGRDELRAKAIAAAAMPVEGLALKIDDDGKLGVEFNGVPFSQASDAERLRVSAAVAMAANPKLRVLRLKDASLLDKKAIEVLRSMATENDFQIWAEFVGDEGSGIIMEAGTVRGAPEPEPLERPKRRRKAGDETAEKEAETPGNQPSGGGDEPSQREHDFGVTGGAKENLEAIDGESRKTMFERMQEGSGEAARKPAGGNLFGDDPEPEPRRRPRALSQFTSKPRGDQ